MEWVGALIIGSLLAYANGSNDNYKGVATLLGSGTTTYRRALFWAALTTGAGSLASIVVGGGILASFSGKGLVAPSLVVDSRFPLAVALASGFTVLLATRLGFPISTTHSLIGALLGAGAVASSEALHWARLVDGFLVPLLVSPFLAFFGAVMIYPLFRCLRPKFGVDKETCICLGQDIVAIVPGALSEAQAMRSFTLPHLAVGDATKCRVRYRGRVLGLRASWLLDKLHFLSAGILSFARGMNDTPKIAALMVGGTLSGVQALVSVGIAMGLGGVLSARRVADTLAHQVTPMNAGQGFSANLIAGTLVVFASRLGLPVSTTHVSCGALFGIGAVGAQAKWGTVRRISLAWLITLPTAAALGVLLWSLLGSGLLTG